MHSAVRIAFASPVRAPRGISGLLQAGGRFAFAASFLVLAGCGNTYRPVVSAINPVGPATQPQKYAVAVSDSGLVSVVDVAGDTLVATAQTSAHPTYFNLGSSGDGYILHCDTTVAIDPSTCNSEIDAFSVSSQLLTRDVFQTSLVEGAAPSVLIPGTNIVYTAQVGNNSIGVLTTGQPPTAQQELPVAPSPTYIVMRPSSSRIYALSAGSAAGCSGGTATAIQTSNSTLVSPPVCVGGYPVYGVMNSDSRRAFVMNKGSGTVSVINTQTNALDISPTVLPTGTITVGQNPLWADTADAINEIAVLNGGDGTSAGSLSIISIPLCNTTTEPTNPTCDVNNPSDGNDFGKVVKTVPVGVNPFMVSILQDQSKAYVSNTDSGTISVIDMGTQIKLKDIPVAGCQPTWIAATGGNPTGKVFVLCKNTQQLSIIYTDTDTLQSTAIPLGGNGVSLRVTAQ